MGGAKVPCALCRTPLPESDEASLVMLRRNVESGNPAAMCLLGETYADGSLGLVPSRKKAARLYQRAADLGDTGAVVKLAYAYEQGSGVKLDRKKMIKYFRMAADRGDAIAQYNLAECFEAGRGVPQDDDEAAWFFKLSADQGFTQAEYVLGCMFIGARGDGDKLDKGIHLWERAAAKGHEDAKKALAIRRGWGYRCREATHTTA